MGQPVPPEIVILEAPVAIAAAEPRRIAINFMFLSVGETAAKALTFLSFSYLARVLGPVSYGSLEFTLAVMVFFSLPVDLGLTPYATREVSRDPTRAPRLLHEIAGLRTILALVSMAALGVFILLFDRSRQLSLMLALYGVSLLGVPFTAQWFFQAHEQMHWVGLASIVRQAAFAVLVFLICRPGSPVTYVGIVECASVAAMAVFCVYVVRYRMGYPWPWPDLRVTHLTAHFKEAFPIGLTELAWGSMWYACTVLLGLFYADASVGWFGASHRGLMALHTFVSLYFFNLLPSISRCSVLPQKHLLELMDQSVRLAAWAGVFGAALLTALAPQLMTLVYGPAFRPAALSFVVLVWMLPIAMLSGHHRFILIAYKRQKDLLRCSVISAVAAVVLGGALIPRFSGPGAAWALLMAIAINFVLVYIAVRRWVVEVPVHRQLAGPIAALAVAGLFYFSLLSSSAWLALAGGCAIYLGGLLWSDGRRLASFLKTLVRGPAAKQPTD